jgi:cytochrome c oxidase assembly protein subunit 15
MIGALTTAEAPDRGEGGARVRSGRAAVRVWLFALAALVVAMVAVGGATRLTGSGLSITEWRPVTGAVPPLSQGGWEAEFAKYRDSPQYALLNRGMSLDEFKFIYAWEWGHRQLGRLIGLAFFGPLLWFWWRGLLDRRLVLALLGLGALGGLQGAVGWIMVASGLEPGMTAVAATKLALHLLIASLILAGLVWIATGLKDPDAPADVGTGRRNAFVLVGLILAQIGLGGLVAGSKAGLTYNTWPLMDGALAPPAAVLFSQTPWTENVFDNLALVQFNHRLMAYVVVGFAVWLAWRTRRGAPGAAARRAAGLAGLALGQAALGVATLLLVVPLWAALAHQFAAMLLLAAAVAHARRCVGDPFRDASRIGHPGRAS